jgi:hypothetical protein
MSEFASKEQFISGQTGKRRYEKVDLPVCALRVRIQSMMEEELSSYQGKFMRKDGRGVIPSKLKEATRALFARCLVGENNERWFGDDDVNAEFFRKMDTVDSGTLFTACKEHCGLDDSDIGIKSEDTEKNSGKTSADTSRSD